jgi:hypothetical protein
MKKFLIIAFLSITSGVSAQEFAVGTNVISGGLGFGGYYGSYKYSSQSPSISLQYERGIWPIDGPGVISLGGFAGFKTYKYDYNFGQFNYKEKWNYTVLGLRSAYHYTGLDVKNLDVYGGLMLSYNILSYSYSDNDPFDNNSRSGNYNSRLGLTLYVGGRYYLTDNLAGFMELGYGVAYVNLGLAYRFP